jgi:hypothetical protein
MIKQIGLLSRRPDLSSADFRAYYESHHRLIGEKYLSGRAIHYMRRYPGKDANVDFDVIMEIWYPDLAAYEAARAKLATPEAIAEIIQDEEQLFDRTKHRFFLVDECVSDIGQRGENN